MAWSSVLVRDDVRHQAKQEGAVPPSLDRAAVRRRAATAAAALPRACRRVVTWKCAMAECRKVCAWRLYTSPWELESASAWGTKHHRKHRQNVAVMNIGLVREVTICVPGWAGIKTTGARISTRHSASACGCAGGAPKGAPLVRRRPHGRAGVGRVLVHGGEPRPQT